MERLKKLLEEVRRFVEEEYSASQLKTRQKELLTNIKRGYYKNLQAAIDDNLDDFGAGEITTAWNTWKKMSPVEKENVWALSADIKKNIASLAKALKGSGASIRTETDEDGLDYLVIGTNNDMIVSMLPGEDTFEVKGPEEEKKELSLAAAVKYIKKEADDYGL